MTNVPRPKITDNRSNVCPPTVAVVLVLMLLLDLLIRCDLLLSILLEVVVKDNDRD